MHKFIVKIPFVIFGLTFSKLEYAEINRVNLLKIDFFFNVSFTSNQNKLHERSKSVFYQNSFNWRVIEKNMGWISNI